MFIGPVFAREVVTSPRRKSFYIARTAYLSCLMVLVGTAWLVLNGNQPVRGVGDSARFGAILFQLMAPLQLALAVFFSALLAAGNIAQEKDRRTLVLLLLTRISNGELVLGKLFASMLGVLVLLAVALPLFMLTALFGGISFHQIARVFAVTLASAMLAGSFGTTIALWREKTFQTLAMVGLMLVIWFGMGEAFHWGLFGEHQFGFSMESTAIAISPYRAIMLAAIPEMEAGGLWGSFSPVLLRFLAVSVVGSGLFCGVAILRVRIWNTAQRRRPGTREEFQQDSIWGTEYHQRQIAKETDETSRKKSPVSDPVSPTAKRPSSSPVMPSRAVWPNPILWREVRTWAYGRRVLMIRAAYLMLFVAAVISTRYLQADAKLSPELAASMTFLPIALVSLMLVNALSITSITTERDGRTLDLLLASDITPKEFVLGKLSGSLYNTKEMVLAPMVMCGLLTFWRTISPENALYLSGGLMLMNVFVAMLGIHCAMIYSNSRHAIAISLGTLFFLLVGVASCIAIMVAFSNPFGDSFREQYLPFLAIVGGGILGLYFAIGAKRPSQAIGWASLLCPAATFWAITSFFLGYNLAIFLVIVFAYGFATAAMMIPAISEFDVTTGRTTGSDA